MILTPEDRPHTGPKGARVEDAGVYEMMWDCKFCGTPKLLGKTHRFCPNCGAAQDPQTRYYPSDSEKIAVQDHQYVGADLICGSCGTPNSASSHNCRQCGASLESAARASTLGEQVRAESVAFDSSGSRDVAKEKFDAEMLRVGVTKPQGAFGGKGKWILIGILAIVVLVIGFFAVSRLWTKNTSVYAVGHTWEREIQIEQMSAVSDNAWCDSMPSGAYSVTRRQEQRSTNRVADGEECSVRRVDNGDGTFRQQRECQPKYREEPVYDSKCYFTIDRWTSERTVNASGQSLSEAPYWPETNLSRTGSCLGCEREGARNDRYVVQFENRDNQNTFECEVEEDRWNNMQEGTAWQIKISVVTGQPQCESLEPAG
jgi:hypothetical protein